MSDPFTPAPAPALPAVSAQSGGGMARMNFRLGDILSQPAIAKSLPMLGLLGVVGAAALAWTALREPPQRDLFRRSAASSG